LVKKRSLGKTKLNVSEVGLGCVQIGGHIVINGIPASYGKVDDETAKQIIEFAIDSGVNVFDTADNYSLGRSECRLGNYLKDRRSEINIFTKAGRYPTYKTPFEIDISYHSLLATLDRSLARLQTDHVELFQVHATPKSETDFINIEKAFKTIKSEGKALYCGISIGAQYQNAVEIIQRDIVDVLQLKFSLINFEPIKEILMLAKKKGVGVIAAEPLAQGFLTGKYSSGHLFPSYDNRSNQDINEIKRKIEFCMKFKFLETQSRSLGQAAIAYVLSRDEVSTCIPGATSVDQLRSNIEASKIILTKDELDRITAIQHGQSP